MKRIKLLAIAALSLCLFAFTSCEKGFFPTSAEDLAGTKWVGYFTFNGYKQCLVWTFTSATEVEYENHAELKKDATKDSPLIFKVAGTYSYNPLKDTFTADFTDDCGFTVSGLPYHAEGHFLISSMTVKYDILDETILYIKLNE